MRPPTGPSGDPGAETPDDGVSREEGLPERVRCPFCGGEDTELHSPFGSALSVATYWCRRCRSPFETFKWTRSTDP